MQKDVKANSKESDELEILSILVKEYENEVYPRIYGTSSLCNQELMQIQSHIKRLRK